MRPTDLTAKELPPYTAALTADRADELTRHIRNGAVTITGTADPAATVNTFHTGSAAPRPAERDASGRWIAPNVPMHPMSNGLVRIQFRVDQDGQAPSYQLSEFSVNKMTTAIGNDANGSITNLPGGMGVPPMILAYDCEGNLACVSNAISGAVSLYWYDQHGRRIAKQENGLLTLYIWDGMDIIATANADGTVREYFTRGIGIAGDVGSLVAETRFSGGTATTTYLHSNWRGDVVMATDAAGNVVGEYSYTTFGEQLSSAGSFVPRFTFSSKERDASGLVYFGFRYYSPVLCRWISEDPIRERGGINLYQFCGDDPINITDSLGLWGIQFGSVNLGRGDPWLMFDNSSWGDLGRGVAATADGVLTAATMGGLFGLFDPNLFSSYYDACDSDTKISHGLGLASFAVATFAFGLPQGATRGASQVVSHWGPQGMTGLRPGDWVMTGGSSVRNWIMSGAKYGPRSAITTTVPKSALQAVPKTEPFYLIKTAIGQRVYVP